jgi:predicted unusual protein kinase regulating ubiquinone biosynthesis (AarF/ABC1/UbiB family)/uncharacterized protein YjbJ (UPF0337 family)
MGLVIMTRAHRLQTLSYFCRVLLICLLSVAARAGDTEVFEHDLSYLTVRHHVSLEMFKGAGMAADEKARVFERAVDLIKGFHEQRYEVVEIHSKRELETLWRRLMPLDQLHMDLTEAEHAVPPKIIVRLHSRELADEIGKLDHAARAMDMEVPVDKLLKGPMGWFTRKFVLGQEPIFLFARLSEGGPELDRMLNKLKAMKTDERAAFFESIDERFHEGEAELRGLGEMISKTRLQAIPHAGYQRLLEILFVEYFKRMPEWQMREIVATIALSPTALNDRRESVNIVISLLGPEVLKLIQLVARSPFLDDQARELLSSVESDLMPVRWERLARQLERHWLAIPIKEVDPIAVGTGTMAQVHKSWSVDKQGRRIPIALRFLKPGIEFRLEQDDKLLMDIARMIDSDSVVRSSALPSVVKIVEDLRQMARIELNIPETVNKQRQAGVLYNDIVTFADERGERSERFHVPDTYDVSALDQGKVTVMAQEWVEGVKLDVVRRQSMTDAQDIFNGFARLWILKATQPDGFFHADLHQGNILVGTDADGNRVTNIIDFGMAAKLEPEFIHKVLFLALVTTGKNPDTIAKALWDIRDTSRTTIQYEHLRNVVSALITKAGDNRPSMARYLVAAGQAGMSFPLDVGQFSRGLVGLERIGAGLGMKLPLEAIARESAYSRRDQLASAIGLGARGKIVDSDRLKSVLEVASGHAKEQVGKGLQSAWDSLRGSFSKALAKVPAEVENKASAPANVSQARTCQMVFSGTK